MPRRTASRSRTFIARSRADRPAGPELIDDAAEHRVADERVERDDDVPVGDLPGPLRERTVAQDQVGIGWDPVDRRVLDCHRQVTKLLLELRHDQRAAAHAGLAREDDLVDVGCLDLSHAVAVLVAAVACALGSLSRAVAGRSTAATPNVT